MAQIEAITRVVPLQSGRTWRVVPTHRQERFDYSKIASAYEPTHVPTDLWRGDLGPFVISQISRIEGLSNDEFWRYSRALARFMSRASRNGHELDIELLTPGHVESYVASTQGKQSSKATLRSDLRRLGRALTRTAPWEPPPSQYQATSRFRPYSHSEIRMFQRDARRQSTRRNEVAARGMLALCAGAGATSGELRLIVSDSIKVSSSGAVKVDIEGPKPRSVPVADDVGVELIELAEIANGSWICGGRSASKNYANGMSNAIMTRQGTRMLPARLRSTWIVDQMARDLPLRTLLTRSGLTLPGSLDDYIQYVDMTRSSDG